ncbi:hypothetical protein C7974DRAFT_468926 [Boeremia exigua]|uniref:uncharacterized protein n=1 Tax=Boeremia exigua TaxID=749465 RepID=UPI001E8D05EC|nr:uncharacterized protein C7974DRAFT_468926 [Boeremia exigua]KAH6642606.1 hypothetical protein C7974DRAFT_468926 [Boeremia exigua]
MCLQTFSVGNLSTPIIIMPRARQTPLQRERKRIALGLSRAWPITRTNRRPRGLNNAGNYCYRHAALQCLMHLPRFLNWIRKHNEPGAHWPCSATDPNASLNAKESEDPILVNMGELALGCFSCLLKTLVNAYWGDVSIGTTAERLPLPFDWSHPAIHRLHRLVERKFCFEPEGTAAACKSRSLEGVRWFRRNARRSNMTGQQDAEEFISLVFNGIESSIDMNERHGPRLKREFDALFTLSETFNTTCLNCERSVIREGTHGLGLRFDVLDVLDGGNDTVYEGLERHRFATYFSDPANIFPCPHAEPCDAPEGVAAATERTIDAAPEYLHLLLNRTDMRRKLTTRVDIPDLLDLTPHITVPEGARAVPLRYRLVNGVFHSGGRVQSGHYVAGVTGAPSLGRSRKVRPTADGEGRESAAPYKYFWVNDSSVTGWSGGAGVNVIATDPVVRGSAFNASFLFYERIHQDAKEPEVVEDTGPRRSRRLREKQRGEDV